MINIKDNSIDLILINNKENKNVNEELHRAVKPGGYLFGIDKPHKSHNSVCDIEDIGFIIKDSISYFFKENEDVKQDVICLAMKPLSEKTFAENVMKWGTGGLNIDGCRVGNFKNTTPSGINRYNQNYVKDGANRKKINVDIIDGVSGRYPANFIISEDVAPVLDEQSKEASRYFKNVDSYKELLKYIAIMGLPPKQGKVLFIGFNNAEEIIKEINNENGTSYEYVGGMN